LANRTLLQERIEKSKRMLGAESTDSSKPKRVLPTPSLSSYIERGVKEQGDLEFDGPFLLSTKKAVEKVTGGFGEIVAERVSRMRSGFESSAPMIDIDSAGEAVALETPAWSESAEDVSDGSPQSAWRSALEEARSGIRPGTPATNLDVLAAEAAVSGPSWPPHLAITEGSGWVDWTQGSGNRVATTAAKQIVREPGGSINPLTIFGTSGVGKSTLANLAASSILDRDPSHQVRVIRPLDMSESTTSPWKDGVARCSCLLVEDIDQMSATESAELATIMDWALNLGVQVIITSSSLPDSGSSLASIIDSGVKVAIEPPSIPTMLLDLRNKALRRGIGLSDEQLRVICSSADGDWRKCESGFETVAISIDAGAEPFGSEDIERLLAGESLPMRGDDGLFAWDAEGTGKRIVREVLDDVLPREAHPNIEITSSLESRVDEYQPPELMPGDSGDAVDALIERHLGREKEDWQASRERIEIEGMPTNLEQPEPRTSSIETLSDGFLDRLESRLRRHQDELFGLHDEMESIAHQLAGASSQELVEMADRMMEIDRKLARISRLQAGESISDRVKPERPYKKPTLDEYVPSGEWDIDEDSIDVYDLLGEAAVLRPIRVLTPVNEEE